MGVGGIAIYPTNTYERSFGIFDRKSPDPSFCFAAVFPYTFLCLEKNKHFRIVDINNLDSSFLMSPELSSPSKNIH